MRLGNFEVASVILKPDVEEEGLRAEILRRLLVPKLGVRGMLMTPFVPTREQLVRHYDKDEAWKRKYGSKRRNILLEKAKVEYNKTLDECACDLDLYEREIDRIEALDPLALGESIIASIYDFMLSGTLTQIVLVGDPDINVRVRDVVGPTDPAASREQGLDTIRGLSPDSFANADAEHRAVRNLVHHADFFPEKGEERVEYELENMFPGIMPVLLAYCRTLSGGGRTL